MMLVLATASRRMMLVLATASRRMMLDRAGAAEMIESADDCCFAAALPSIDDGEIRARRRSKRHFGLLSVSLVHEVEAQVDSVSVIERYDLSAANPFVADLRALAGTG